MLHEIANKIARWISEKQGQQPSRIRLSRAAIEQIKDDMRQLELHPRSDGLNDMRIMGVEVVEDNSVALEQIDP